VEISKSGAFVIEAGVVVNVNKQDLMIENSNGVIDGVIVADLCQYGQTMGSALMALPMFGVKDYATVKGLGTGRADSTKPYEIKFRSLHLWIMEE
jgi:hypothetical protein